MKRAMNMAKRATSGLKRRALSQRTKENVTFAFIYIATYIVVYCVLFIFLVLFFALVTPKEGA